MKKRKKKAEFHIDVVLEKWHPRVRTYHQLNPSCRAASVRTIPYHNITCYHGPVMLREPARPLQLPTDRSSSSHNYLGTLKPD